MEIAIPERLANACGNSPERASWLAQLPDSIRQLQTQWSLTIGTLFDGPEVSCAWVTSVALADGTPAVLKIGLPHMESEHEIEGLRFWDGDPTVRLLAADTQLGAMLLEQCLPGTPLRAKDEVEQDVVIARLLRRMWRAPLPGHPFRSLSVMVNHWSEETLAGSAQWRDTGLVLEGLRLFKELSRTSPADTLLATDLHAGNVLEAQREPWLVIDPKPFVGDPAYDATQHLLNCESRLRTDPYQTIGHLAGLLDIPKERIRLWMFARAAAEPRDDWRPNWLTELARILAP